MHIRLILSAAAAFMLLTSCGDYTRLLKSRDYEKQYQKALELYNAGKEKKALNLFMNVETIYAGTERMDTIKFYSAKICFNSGDYYSSGEILNDFRKNYGRSRFAPEAEYLYACSMYELSPDHEVDQTPSTRAIMALDEYISRYPDGAYRERAEAMMDDLSARIYLKDFQVGETYYNIGYYNSAIVTFRNLLKRHPDLPQREQVLYLILKSQYLYARKSVPSKQQERFMDVLDSYYTLLSQYPETEYLRSAKRMFDSAQKVIKGDAYVSDDKDAIISTQGKIYDAKDKLLDKIMMLEDEKMKDTGKKADKQIAKLKKRLEVIDRTITELEQEKAKQKAAEFSETLE